jgi:quercetin dioxygenase-like cupin family protein
VTSEVGKKEVGVTLRIGAYERTVCRRGNGIEAVEINWHPRTRTPKHNHASKGWVWVLKGRIFEIKDGRKNYYEAGDTFLEVHGEDKHIVGNDTHDPAVTFHVYMPELEMQVFPDSEADLLAVLM